MATEKEIIAEFDIVSARATALDDIIHGIFAPRLHAAISDESKTHEQRMEAGQKIIFSCPQSVARALLCDTLRCYKEKTLAAWLDAALEDLEEDL